MEEASGRKVVASDISEEKNISKTKNLFFFKALENNPPQNPYKFKIQSSEHSIEILPMIHD